MSSNVRGETWNSSSMEHPTSSGRSLYEPVAVVGYSLKFPQDATSPASFWKMLEDRRCAMAECPKDRMNIDGYYNPEGVKHDAVSARSRSSDPVTAGAISVQEHL